MAKNTYPIEASSSSPSEADDTATPCFYLTYVAQHLLSIFFLRSNPAINNIEQIEQVIRRVSNLRLYGCASLDALSVACETSSIYWERYVNWWDIAAALLIVEEAGGSTMCELSPSGRGLQVGAASSQKLLESLKEILGLSTTKPGTPHAFAAFRKLRNDFFFSICSSEEVVS